MPSRFFVVVPLAAAMFVWSSPRAVEACSCVMPPAPKKAMGDASAVFAGKVVKIDHDAEKHRVTARFEVSRWWKGGETAQTNVSTVDAGSMCGVTFAVGEEWMIYADGPADGLNSGICSRTKKLADAKDDQKALGAGKAPNASLTSPPEVVKEVAPAPEPTKVEAPKPLKAEPRPAPAPVPVEPVKPAESQGCSLAPRGDGTLGLLLVGGLLLRRRRW